jgi:glycosyltransferase involved in cell wall biosynthesis
MLRSFANRAGENRMLQKPKPATHPRHSSMLKSIDAIDAPIRGPVWGGPCPMHCAREQHQQPVKKKTMKLIYADPHPLPGTIPSSIQILQTVDALGETGIDVDVLTPQVRNGTAPVHILGRELSPRVTLRWLPDIRKRWYFPLASHRPFYWMAGHWIRHRRADAVIVRNLKLAEHLLRITDIPPVFFESHEVHAQTFRESHRIATLHQRRKLAALERRERFVYRNADGLVALTPFLLADIRARYDTFAPSLVVPDGVDLRLAAAALQAPVPAPRQLLYLGSLHPWKGVEVLLEALVHVRDARLRIVGGTVDRIRTLRRLARRFGVSTRAEFTGPVSPAQRFAVIAEAQICLLPSTNTSIGGRYTSPLKLFEYMAMGKPVVAGNLPAIRSVLSHGRNALLAEPGSPRAFADRIRELLADPQLGRQLGAQAAVDARSYCWTRRAEHIGRFVELALRHSSQRTRLAYYGA